MDLVFEPLTSAVLVPCSWTEPTQIKLIQPPKSVVITDPKKKPEISQD